MIILNPQNRQDNRTAQALRESHTSHEITMHIIFYHYVHQLDNHSYMALLVPSLCAPNSTTIYLCPIRPSQNHVERHEGQATMKRPNQQMKTCIRYWLFLYHFSLFLSISYAKRPKWHYTRFTTMPGTFNKWLNHAVHRHQLNYYFP